MALLSRLKGKLARKTEPAPPIANMISNLCDKCKVLSFDDWALGGYGPKTDGNINRIFPNPPEGISRDSMWTPLDYQLHDELPGLLYLTVSANAGCGFCSLLRASICETLGEQRRSRYTTIQARLVFGWRVVSWPRHGLEPPHYALTVLVVSCTLLSGSSASEDFQLSFKTEAPPGK